MPMTNPYAAYTMAQKRTAGGRPLEAEAFIKSVRLLERAQLRPYDQHVLATALRHTWMVWTVVQASLANRRHPMPEKLKADILSLSVFVDRQIVRAMREGGSYGLQPLIDVNLDMARAQSAAGTP